MDYGEQDGAYEILDFKDCVESRGRVRIVTTSQVKIHPAEFPFREPQQEERHYESWKMTMRPESDGSPKNNTSCRTTNNDILITKLRLYI